MVHRNLIYYIKQQFGYAVDEQRIPREYDDFLEKLSQGIGRRELL